MNLLPMLLAQNNDGDAAATAAAFAGFLCMMAFYALFLGIIVGGMWMTFAKAGRPGWAAIIPIYNIFVLTEIARKEILWFILTLVPCVNIIAIIMINMDVAKNFGKGAGYGLGLTFLPFIFYPMLGFGSARYQGVAGLKQ